MVESYVRPGEVFGEAIDELIGGTTVMSTLKN